MSDLSDVIQDSLRPIRKLYFGLVRDIAKEALELYPDDDEKRGDWIHESVDGCEWVIYTYKARLVAVLTDNVDAVDDYWIEGPIAPETLAHAAMLADVNETVEAFKEHGVTAD